MKRRLGIYWVYAPVSFEVGEGEFFAFLGPNGAGKTTTIRCLMGFMSPDTGQCTIAGRDCFHDAPAIQKNLGYIPGEIAFFDKMTGEGFLRFLHRLRGTTNLTRQQELIARFEFDPRGQIKRFYKGMKQKVGIVAAFMHDPQVIILDEPTSGLDPLMQNRFVDLVREEKQKGKTILMSSHLFEEIEKTADRVLVIKDGRIVAADSVSRLKDQQKKVFLLTLTHARDIKKLPARYARHQLDATHFEVAVEGKQINHFLQALCALRLDNLQSKVQSLEEVFLNYYGKN